MEKIKNKLDKYKDWQLFFDNTLNDYLRILIPNCLYENPTFSTKSAREIRIMGGIEDNGWDWYHGHKWKSLVPNVYSSLDKLEEINLEKAFNHRQWKGSRGGKNWLGTTDGEDCYGPVPPQLIKDGESYRCDLTLSSGVTITLDLIKKSQEITYSIPKNFLSMSKNKIDTICLLSRGMFEFPREFVHLYLTNGYKMKIRYKENLEEVIQDLEEWEVNPSARGGAIILDLDYIKWCKCILKEQLMFF